MTAEEALCLKYDSEEGGFLIANHNGEKMSPLKVACPKGGKSSGTRFSKHSWVHPDSWLPLLLPSVLFEFHESDSNHLSDPLIPFLLSNQLTAAVSQAKFRILHPGTSRQDNTNITLSARDVVDIRSLQQ